jgi:hypothetical protein
MGIAERMSFAPVDGGWLGDIHTRRMEMHLGAVDRTVTRRLRRPVADTNHREWHCHVRMDAGAASAEWDRVTYASAALIGCGGFFIF